MKKGGGAGINKFFINFFFQNTDVILERPLHRYIFSLLRSLESKKHLGFQDYIKIYMRLRQRALKFHNNSTTNRNKNNTIKI